MAGTVPGGAGLDLQTAGISIIQVDEPALRELLPLREQDRKAYLVWAVSSFRLATAGVADSTAVHTHLCYSEFGDVIGAIDDLDADMTSLEAVRSHMEVLGDLNADGYSRGVGPGVLGHPFTARAVDGGDHRVVDQGAGRGTGRPALGEPRLPG